MDNQKNEHIQLTRNQKLVLTSSSLGFGLENMDVLFLSFTMSSIIASLHVSAGAAGLIGTITNWGMLLGGVLFGMLGDRFGRVKTFTYTIFVFALATALMSIANNITSIYIFRFIAGIGAGGEYGLGITLIAEAFPKKELGRMSSIASIGGQVGAVAAAIIAAFVIPSLGWHALYLFGLLPIILVFFVRRHIKESAEFLRVKENRKITIIHAIKKYMFADLGTAWTSIGLMIMTTVQIAGYFGLMNWLPSIVEQQSHLSVKGSSLWMISTIIGMSIGMMTFGTIFDKMGPRLSFGIFLLASAVLVYALAYAHSIGLLLIIGAVVGFFSNGMYGGYGAIVSRIYPTEVRSSANNIIVGVGRAVGGMSSLVIGLIMERYSLIVVMLFLSILYLISFTVMMTLPGLKNFDQSSSK
ncbi:MFS transporter [Fructilactobacillus sanfranciscensis]|uniref:MFS transporter n=1 Tax=Fructilactobacillus sanfranciscensis TaxID=1625 RepID=UPI000CD483F0|nr:MFS transporter [Fructilactobacillus sanfranciscensis]MCG7194895.1 MFS transporter [Fructilactobacillus sanfranciscensis]POH08516.1 MFS transporter [Fructilactobacillus sanfranciscensis]POH09536.1 MFS transporter [Fructilactobacillus sanfranciscensis]POH15813.1 MFS transporter [Fructilactobacillus sanfranciscensis]TNK99123.1 MFS transporter [Fructilactobacillus sanfranciscensis]